jgi:hypothetical protein
MMTREQALRAQEFHLDTGCPTRPTRNSKDAGPVRWRTNGKATVWVTRPTEFRIPVKHGLYGYEYVTERDLGTLHVSTECPRDV